MNTLFFLDQILKRYATDLASLTRPHAYLICQKEVEIDEFQINDLFCLPADQPQTFTFLEAANQSPTYQVCARPHWFLKMAGCQKIRYWPKAARDAPNG